MKEALKPQSWTIVTVKLDCKSYGHVKDVNASFSQVHSSSIEGKFLHFAAGNFSKSSMSIFHKKVNFAYLTKTLSISASTYIIFS